MVEISDEGGAGGGGVGAGKGSLAMEKKFSW